MARKESSSAHTLPRTLFQSWHFFASKCELGENGLEKVLGCGEMDSFEKVQVSNATAELKASIEKGVEFANAPAAEK